MVRTISSAERGKQILYLGGGKNLIKLGQLKPKLSAQHHQRDTRVQRVEALFGSVMKHEPGAHLLNTRKKTHTRASLTADLAKFKVKFEKSLD